MRIGALNIIYIKKRTAATEYKIAATSAAQLAFINTPSQPKIAPIAIVII